MNPAIPVVTHARRKSAAKAPQVQTLFDDPMIREAYRRGVRDAYESACIHLPPPRRRAMEEWLTTLDLWNGGDPPPPPHSWAGASS